MQTLYHWWMAECLKNYSAGDIIVIAESVEDARKKARAQIDTFLRENHREWWFMPDGTVDPDYTDDYQQFIRKLEEDLSKEPDLIEHHVIFITGSE